MKKSQAALRQQKNCHKTNKRQESPITTTKKLQQIAARVLT